MESSNFIIKNILESDERNKFANIKIYGVDITSEKLDEYISDIVLNTKNLLYGFSIRSEITKDLLISIYNRFIPQNIGSMGLDEYINLQTNPSFYSFLGEYLLCLVLKDVFNFVLSASVINITDTTFDNHTGVDGCFYDDNNKIIILGEAKFYKNIKQGLKQIKNDLSKNDFSNKLMSLYAKATSNSESLRIIMQNLDVNNYRELTFDDFTTLNLLFVGFVMHEDLKSTTPKELKDFADFDASEILSNSLRLKLKTKNDYSLLIMNLPVKSKEELIKLVINKAAALKRKL